MKKENVPIEKSQDPFRLQKEVKRLKKALEQERHVAEFLRKTIAFFKEKDKKNK